ncbi:hypothetical protein ACFX2A_007117 [Malus domestica]
MPKASVEGLGICTGARAHCFCSCIASELSSWLKTRQGGCCMDISMGFMVLGLHGLEITLVTHCFWACMPGIISSYSWTPWFGLDALASIPINRAFRVHTETRLGPLEAWISVVIIAP